ncbi:uncharacterized protein LOC135688532 [Rhopilema esculentum]|uniref:uncharacterized protein LOC135688532 n=1 Tax=Rhopilema esculentum TaxID=499914 RepID=UPI0031D553FF
MSKESIDHHALISNGYLNTAPSIQPVSSRSDIKTNNTFKSPGWSVSTSNTATHIYASSIAPTSCSIAGTLAPCLSGSNSGNTQKTSSNALSTSNLGISQAVQHPANGHITQMITSGDVFKMAPAPLFMTHSSSVYPQVALIPETDLLRSMIVQDVKQVTQKLLDKNTKKRRGRRSRKEEIIPGDFGTLKINFTKFVDKERPPFSLEEPPAPKRTVYQRIAPYPVAVTEPSAAHILEKPTRKTKGASGRSLKRLDKSEADSVRISRLDGAKETQSRRLQRLRRSSSSGSRSNKNQGSGTGTPCNSSSTESRGSTDETSLGLSADVILSTEENLANSQSIDASTISEVKDVLENLNMNVFDPATDTLCLETGAVSAKLIDNKFTAEEIETNASICKDSLFDENSNHLRFSSSQSINGDSTVYSGLLDSSPTTYGLSTNIGSPDVIGNELKSLLSELYSDFPPLSPANIDENMDVGALGETLGLNATSESSSSRALSSAMTTAVLADRRPQTAILESFIQGAQPSPQSSARYAPGKAATISSSGNATKQPHTTNTNAICQTVVQCTTEVLSDSNWNNTCRGRVVEPAASSSVLDSDFVMTTRIEGTEGNSRNLTNSEETVFSMEVDVNQLHDGDGSKSILDIVDISPEYASAEGGGKIILIGSWNNKNARYSCRFGNVCTPGDLIQNGVLRCFCPPHSPGKVKVSVLCNDAVITKSVDFEYVDTEEQLDEFQEERHDWLKISDEDLKLLLVERIEAISDIFDAGNSVQRFPGHLCNTVDLEDALVRVCESISKLQDHLPINIDYKSDSVMTVLHLSAALGYTKLIQTLCNWIETNSNKIMLQEADPLKYDQFQLTPLMWACAKGKFDTVCVLLQWEESAVHQTDMCGCSPLSISRDQGHSILVRYLEKSQSKGNISKTSSLASESGSPNMRSGRLSRSSSMGSHAESSREFQPGTDDTTYFDSSRRSPGSNKISQDGSPDSINGSLQLSRTLGQTLVHVQAIIQDGVDAHHDPTRASPLTSLDLDDDSLFTPSPFTPSIRRLNSSADDRHGNHTPKALVSLSPASPGQSSGCQSPFDATLRDTAEFCEFFYNSERILEKDFAELTLTDEEQQNLYKAASVIQNAYKRYRERRKQRDAELSAAVLIQSYYRRYKQYAMFKKMQRGAVVIQHKYRAHREKEKQKSQAASVIQSYYRRYKERKNVPDVGAISERMAPSILDQAGSSLQMNRPSTLPDWRKKRVGQTQPK